MRSYGDTPALATSARKLQLAADTDTGERPFSMGKPYWLCVRTDRVPTRYELAFSMEGSRSAHTDPSKRYPTAAALVDDLQRFLDGRPTWARPLSSLQRLQRWSRRHRGASLAAVVSLVSLLLAGGVVWKSFDDASQQSRVLSEAWLARQAANQDAVAQKKKYQQLALRNGLRTAYDLYEQGRLYAAARELQDLRARHPDDQSSPAAVLLGAELQERFEILGEFGKPLREVVPLPGRSQLALAGDSPHILLYDLEHKPISSSRITSSSKHSVSSTPISGCGETHRT